MYIFICFLYEKGLDPALPLFITASTRDKLDESDANFVDVIHSNALVQGKIERCGHADFYMNGGIIQPGCYQPDSSVFSKFTYIRNQLIPIKLNLYISIDFISQIPLLVHIIVHQTIFPKVLKVSVAFGVGHVHRI